MLVNRRAALLGLSSTAVLLTTQARARLSPTPTTDMGPFYPVARVAEDDADLTLLRGRSKRAAGQVIEVTGRILDKRGNPVRSARIELWQANAAGRYAHPGDTSAAPLDEGFQGFARLVSGRDGSYRYTTIKPGAYPDGNGAPRPPHIHLDVLGRKDRIVTQMLFPGDPLNDTDDVIPPSVGRRLTATALGQDAGGTPRFGWDIILDNG